MLHLRVSRDGEGSDNAAVWYTDMTVAQPPTSSFDSRAEEPAVGELVIQPRRGWIAVDWAEMFRYRELLGFLIWRDVKVRYKQSVLGVAWAVIVPVLNMLIFTVIFNVLFRFGKDMKSPDGRLIPYAIFVYSALLPWQLFSNALGTGGMALLNQQHLITKIYFPRLFLPTAAVGGLLVDMAISFGVLAVLMGVYHFTPMYGFTPGWRLLALPVLVLITIVLGLGVAYLLSALTVTYRDFRFLIPFTNQILMYCSFVAYPIPESSFAHHPHLRELVSLNPMFGIIEAFRSAILQTEFHPQDLAVSIAISAIMFVFGMFYFRRTERRFADIA
jgi:lipopolysaccharide transport system permease protein